MPIERAPTPQSHTAVSLGNSSDDRNSERSDSFATVEIFRSDGGDSDLITRTPSETTENMDRENVSRHRTPIVVDEDKKSASSDIPEIPPERKRSGGISKGVILNAMNFGAHDLTYNIKEMQEKTVVPKDQEQGENGSLSPKTLEKSSDKNASAGEDEEGEGKKKMSLLRKIAFGFSFLPSVMFVLTFAVILPCEEENNNAGGCIRNKWSLFLNDTEITSEFSLRETLLLGYHFSNSTSSFDGIVNLDYETSKEIWKLPLDSQPKLLQCLKVDANEDGVKDCFTILENGNVCAFNLSDGNVLAKFNLNKSEGSTVLLPGCPYYERYKPVAVASYNKENTLSIDVLSVTDGSVLVSREVKLFDKCLTFNMKSWEHDNEVDLVFFCKDIQNQGYIWRVRQSLWCSPGEQSIIVPQLLMRFDYNETGAIYLPTIEGVLVWAGAQITFLESDGTVRWTYSAHYVLQNRVAKFGSFYIGGKQIAVIGQNASCGVVVSMVRSEDGKELSTFSFPDTVLNQATILQGNETDSLLISVLKVNMTETEQVSDKETVFSNDTSSPDMRKNLRHLVNGKKSIGQELILLQFGSINATHVILEMNEMSLSCEKGSVCEFEYQPSLIISAFADDKENSMDLKMVMLKTPDNDLKQNKSRLFAQLTALDITHQDNPDSGETVCTL